MNNNGIVAQRASIVWGAVSKKNTPLTERKLSEWRRLGGLFIYCCKRPSGVSFKSGSNGDAHARTCTQRLTVSFFFLLDVDSAAGSARLEEADLASFGSANVIVMTVIALTLH